MAGNLRDIIGAAVGAESKLPLNGAWQETSGNIIGWQEAVKRGHRLVAF